MTTIASELQKIQRTMTSDRENVKHKISKSEARTYLHFVFITMGFMTLVCVVVVMVLKGH